MGWSSDKRSVKNLLERRKVWRKWEGEGNGKKAIPISYNMEKTET